jgi:regulator of sirC expression with transglutaminase-like and TPR domain
VKRSAEAFNAPEPMTDQPADPITDQQLLAFLDEGLEPKLMAELEQRLRSEPALQQRLLRLIDLHPTATHSIGGIWRQERISCPSREELSNFLLGLLSEPQAQYIDFHLSQVGCPLCQYSLTDLRQQASAAAQPDIERRRQRFFQSTIGRSPR